jgi:ATP-dependent DNA helicase RecG
MHHDYFKYLQQKITVLPGIAESLAKYLKKLLNNDRLFDLCLHLPSKAEPITQNINFHLQGKQLAVLSGVVQTHQEPQNSKQPHKIICQNQNYYFSLIFFKIFPSQLQTMKIGQEIAVLGYVNKNFSGFEILHPIRVVPIQQMKFLPKIHLTYPLSAGIANQLVINKIQQILAKMPIDAVEWISPQIKQQNNWQGFYASIKSLHQAVAQTQIENPYWPARRRLAFDELLAWQLATLMIKQKLVVASKNIICHNHHLINNFITSLPFSLTLSQQQVSQEISADILSNKPMFRILQGDVGSGKTVVAIIACLQAISCQKQVAVLVPTTILALQHFKYFSQLLQKFNIKIGLLISDLKKTNKQKLLKQLKNQELDLIIGTHALLEPEVEFANLGLAIIDEQHRFGVVQRLTLTQKGNNIDLLLMSATPIPRSLMMAIYGDTAISIIKQKPMQRKKITTLLMSNNKIVELSQSLLKFLDKSEKIYWICPAIEEKEITEKLYNNNINLTSVQTRYNELSKIIPAKHLAVLHGKLKDQEKDAIMLEFADINSEKKILIATTVIEVGIDISSATIIIIENAENFGLAQLHQLRGRVGRSDLPSFCILLHNNTQPKQRLQILKQSDDGFFIAEQDLKLRGSGEIIGTKQSGFPEFKIANLTIDYDLLAICHKQAKEILASNNNDMWQIYQQLMTLFNYQNCLDYCRG